MHKGLDYNALEVNRLESTLCMNIVIVLPTETYPTVVGETLIAVTTDIES